MKTRRLIIGGLALLMGLISCSKDDSSPFRKVTVIVKSNDLSGHLKSATVAPTLELTEVIVNVKEIEFDFDDDHDCDCDQEECTENHGDIIFSDVELEGPFVLNLLSDGILLVEALGEIELPIAGLKEVEFELSPAIQVENEDPLYGRSVYLSGTIDAVPFEIWSYTDEKIEIEFPDKSSFVLDEAAIFLFIDFHLAQILEGLQTLDLNHAGDGNQNGVIEIGPDDEDGNNAIADQIIHYLKNSFDLDDDDDHDDDDDDDDHDDDDDDDDHDDDD